MIRLFHGDAGRLDAIADGSVHLVVTSPPYPMIPQWDALFARSGARTFDAMHELLDAAWRECRRVLVPGGILAVNIGDALRTVHGTFRLWPNHARVLLAGQRLGFHALPYLLWKKPTNRPNAFLGSGFLPPNAYVTLDCEFILLFRNGPLRRFAPRATARTRSRYTRAERDLWFSQVWDGIRGAPQGRNAGRSAAFPPEIPRRLVSMFSCVGDAVLDPFAGTGTTLWVADALGRDAIGVEADPDRYRALSEERLRRAGAGVERERRSPRGPSSGGRAPRPRRA